MIIVGIIPARYDSTRFPGKPLVDIGGKTMIQRVFEQTKKVLTHVCVATDDDRIFNAVKEFGGEVVITGAHHASGTDRCFEAVEKFEIEKNFSANVVINIQGDEPFIDPIQIQQLSDLFKHKDTEIATLIKIVEQQSVLNDPNVVKVVYGSNGNALYFSRNCIPFVRNVNQEDWLDNQDFYQHIGMYGYKRNVLSAICKLQKSRLENAESLEQLRWLENGFTIKTAITDIDSVGIDTPEDLQKVLKNFKD
ncbi:MAG: 3-deoxy-manno-octulosonate cytidylyltransferase [Salinivirgaceae bacterium]|jgi:3-deoxy-manno-octulosonate cytidylyltransferase (CMP-KDO synthetase)|nr:3-deoxy-manno-octulosonate cytidylyltransferase [Salinivirgaceae bacterium]